MFVDHQNHFCFLAIPKTGSKSISCALGQTQHPAPELYHMTVQELVDSNPDTKNYMKFVFVRNPFSRIVSLYYDFTLKRKYMYSEFDRRDKPLLSEFKDFCDFCIRLKDSEWIKDRFFWPQVDFITYDGKFVDYVGKFERLEADFRYICDQLSLKDVALTVQNKGVYEEKDYRKHYSPEARSAIQQLYSKDLMIFGYEY